MNREMFGRILGLLVVGLLIPYLLGVYVQWDWNVAHWPPLARVGEILIGIGFVGSVIYEK